jgi:2-polyprenyl-3-methyl-5-hydroxy-6-metoxy-1,4-benzoquinol methylase/glycosyltransferase involved in cell wall biosynthesis
MTESSVSPIECRNGDKQSVRCPICHSFQVVRLCEVDGYTVWRCPKSRADFVWPAPSSLELRKLYDASDYFQGDIKGGYRDYDDQTEPLLGLFEGLLGKMGEIAKAGRSILDVGCAYGSHLKVAAQRGWDCYGLEPSAHARGVAKGRLRGDAWICSSIDQLIPHEFDVILLFDVIEHFSDPYSVFFRLFEKGAITERTQIFISTPNARCNAALNSPKQWEYRHPPTHLVFYSSDAIFQLLSRLRFTKIAVSGLYPTDAASAACFPDEISPRNSKLQRYGGLLCQASGSDFVKFMQERYVPGTYSQLAEYEHIPRYQYCQPLVKGKRVLDFGCGMGYGSDMLSDTAASVLGVDISQDALKWARMTHRKKNLRFKRRDDLGAGLPSASFEVITCFEVIEHLANKDQDRLIESFSRLLKPHGKLVISTPNPAVTAKRGDKHYHSKELTKDEFVSKLRKYFPHVLLYDQRIQPSVFLTNGDHLESSRVTNLPCHESGTTVHEVAWIAVCAVEQFEHFPNFCFLEADRDYVTDFLRDQHELNTLRISSRRLSRELSGFKTAVDNLRSVRAQHETMIAALKDQVSLNAVAEAGLKDQLAQNKAREAALKDQLAQHEARTAVLNEQLAQHEAREATLNGQLAQHEAREATLNGQLAQHEAREDTLNDRLAHREARQAILNDQIEGQRTVEMALWDQLRQLEAREVGLHNQLAEHQAREAALNNQVTYYMTKPVGFKDLLGSYKGKIRHGLAKYVPAFVKRRIKILINWRSVAITCYKERSRSKKPPVKLSYFQFLQKLTRELLPARGRSPIYNFSAVRAVQKKRPVILHAIPNVMVGGSTQLIKDLCNHIGHEYEFEIITSAFAPQGPHAGVPIHDFSALRSPDRVLEYLRHKKPSLVHVHFWGDTDTLWYTNVFGALNFYNCHCVQNVNTPVQAFHSPKIDANVFVSRYVLDLFDHGNVPTHIIHPGIDFRGFQPPRRYAENTVGMVYRLEPDKLGPDTMAPFIMLAQKRPQTLIYIVGYGSLFDHFYKQVATAGVLQNFVFTGYVKFKELRKYYSRFSVFVAPVAVESFGQVSPFAMSMGIPVAGYRLGSLEEITGSDETLRSTPQELCDLLVTMLDEKEYRRRVGESHMARAREMFDVKEMCRKYDELYRKILSGDLKRCKREE